MIKPKKKTLLFAIVAGGLLAWILWPAASGVEIPEELMTRIDEALGDVVVRDPALTEQNTPKTRPC